MFKIKKVLSSKYVHLLISTALEKAKKLNINISVAVVDDAGYLLAFSRMDDAKLFSIDLAIKKAYTSAFTQVDTHQWKEWAEKRSLFGIESNSKLALFSGGLKVKDKDGNIIGGIGVSGGIPDQDRECRKYAIKNI